MKRISTFAGAIAIAASLAAGPVAGAAVTHNAMAPVTKTGKFVKLDSSTSFTMTVSKTSYLIKTNHMTHVTENHMVVKLSILKRGDSVTVKGPLEMHTISATSVTAGM